MPRFFARLRLEWSCKQIAIIMATLMFVSVFMTLFLVNWVQTSSDSSASPNHYNPNHAEAVPEQVHGDEKSPSKSGPDALEYGVIAVSSLTLGVIPILPNQTKSESSQTKRGNKMLSNPRVNPWSKPSSPVVVFGVAAAIASAVLQFLRMHLYPMYAVIAGIVAGVISRSFSKGMVSDNDMKDIITCP